MRVQTAGSSKADTSLFVPIVSINANIIILTASMRYNVQALEQNFTVNAALVPILVVDPLRKYLVTLRNVSAAAQIIRVGAAPSFVLGAELGQVLNVNDTLVLDGIGVNINAIASAAGALLSVLCYSTQQLV